MSYVLDIFLPQNGIAITLFRLLQVRLMFYNDSINIQLVIYRLGIQLELRTGEKNLCLEMQEVKKQ